MWSDSWPVQHFVYSSSVYFSCTLRVKRAGDGSRNISSSSKMQRVPLSATMLDFADVRRWMPGPHPVGFGSDPDQAMNRNVGPNLQTWVGSGRERKAYRSHRGCFKLHAVAAGQGPWIPVLNSFISGSMSGKTHIKHPEEGIHPALWAENDAQHGKIEEKGTFEC